MSRIRNRPPAAVVFPFLGLGVVAFAVAAVLGGATAVTLSDFAHVVGGTADRTTRTIVVEYRLPRAVLAVVIGVALGTAGAAYQALFRNPLADPFIIGTSSGAALGVAVAAVTGSAAVTTGAFAGAVGAVALVYAAAAAGRLPTVGLLLAGAAVSTMLSAGVWLLVALAGEQQAAIVGWLMGGLSGRGWPEAKTAGPLILAGAAVLSLLGRPLDAVACGDDAARALGLRVNVVAGVVLASATLAVAAAVAAGGVVGFVGLVAPHLARPLVGAAHARVVPASGLIGGMLVVAADIAARTAAPQELPLGVITSLIGGPFFLLVLVRSAARAGR